MHPYSEIKLNKGDYLSWPLTLKNTNSITLIFEENCTLIAPLMNQWFTPI